MPTMSTKQNELNFAEKERSRPAAKQKKDYPFLRNQNDQRSFYLAPRDSGCTLLKENKNKYLLLLLFLSITGFAMDGYNQMAKDDTGLNTDSK